MQMDTRVNYEEVVAKTVEEIKGRLDDPPSFRELADMAFLSPYHFHRIFRAMLGESPAEMTRRLRLERAAWQVRNTTLPITEIAFDAGYATHEAFTKAFQSEFETSPSSFRSGLRQCQGIPSRNGLHFLPEGFTLFHFIDQGGMEMKTEVVEMPAKRLAGIRHTGAYHTIGRTFEVLGQKAGPLGLFKGPDSMMIGLYYDDPETTPESELQSMAAVSVDEDAQIGDLEESRLEAGKYLKAEFVGHYSGLDQAWAQFYGKSIAESGHALRDGACLEVYVSDHATTPPDQLVTHLYAPIR